MPIRGVLTWLCRLCSAASRERDSPWPEFPVSAWRVETVSGSLHSAAGSRCARACHFGRDDRAAAQCSLRRDLASHLAEQFPYLESQRLGCNRFFENHCTLHGFAFEQLE